MAAIRGNFPQLLAPALAKVILDKTKSFPEEYTQFCSVETSDRAYEDEQMIGEFGKPQIKRELAPIVYDDMFQGPSQRFINETYATGWIISREMLQDEKYGIMRQMPGKLVRGCRDTWEQVAANILNLGFTTQLTADGVSFFNSAHPKLNPSGGSDSNLLATDLSVTGLKEAILIGENMENDRYLKAPVAYDELFFAPDQQFTAQEILSTAMVPYSGENTENVMYGRFKPVSLHFLTSSTAWFVRDSKGEDGPKFYWRERPRMDSTDDFDSEGSKHKLVFRIAAGVTYWRNWLGSNP